MDHFKEKLKSLTKKSLLILQTQSEQHEAKYSNITLVHQIAN